ncbi:MAG: hypothetical protein ACR2RF_25440 [Geminicoccaceae bacterium]
MAGEITRGVIAGFQIRQARENAARVEQIQQRQLELQRFGTLADIITTTQGPLRKTLLKDFLRTQGGNPDSPREKLLIEGITQADEQQSKILSEFLTSQALQGIPFDAARQVSLSDLAKAVIGFNKAKQAETFRRTRPETTFRSVPQPSGEVQETAFTSTPSQGVVGEQRLGEPGVRVPEVVIQPSAGERTALAQGRALISQVQDIEDLTKKFGGELPVGIVSGRTLRARAAIGQTSSDENDLLAALDSLANQLILLRSGAAVTESEFERFKNEFPQVTDPPARFRAKLRRTKRNFGRLQRELRQGLRKITPSDAQPELGGVEGLFSEQAVNEAEELLRRGLQ